MAQVSVLPHEIGRDPIPELATRAYSSQLDSFREAVSNAFDEDSKQVALTIRKDRIVIEDRGNGIKDYDEFRKFGQASKKARSGEVIGEKGLGKLSLLNFGNSVCFETNNGKVGMKFFMSLAGFSRPIYGRSAAFVGHRGTRITVTHLTKGEEIGRIVAYIRRAFGLRLAQGAEITVNGEKIKPKLTLDPSESPLFSLQKDVEVTGNLKAEKDGKGIADVYVDHVFVTSIEVDTRRCFAGWVNCNALTPETSRNNIVQDEVYRRFFERLRRYVSRFPAREVTTDQHQLLVSKELNTLLKSYIKDIKISVDKNENGSSDRFGGGSVRAGKKSSKTAQIKLSLHGAEGLQKKAPNSRGISVRWEYADLGKVPIHFLPPNVIYCNTSNDLFRFAIMKNGYYGPTWLRMPPYLARIAVEIGTESFRLPPDEFNARVDEATRYFLKQKKVLA
jgi:hypothetical protein